MLRRNPGSGDSGSAFSSHSSEGSPERNPTELTEFEPDNENSVDEEPWTVSERMYVVGVALGFATNITVMFAFNPYIADLVFDFGVVKRKKDVGYFTGLITFVFYVGQVIACLIWPRISDCVGRRPVFLISAFSNLLCAILLAFSSNYYYVLIIRFLTGVLAGSLPVCKVGIGENPEFNSKKRTVAFAGLSGVVAIYSIFGPLFGGALARPTRQYPSLFAEGAVFAFARSFFDTFPFVLPNLVCGVINLLCFVMTFLFAYETNSKVLCRSEAAGEAGAGIGDGYEDELEDEDAVARRKAEKEPEELVMVDVRVFLDEVSDDTVETDEERGMKQSWSGADESLGESSSSRATFCYCCLGSEICTRPPIAMMLTYIMTNLFAFCLLTSNPVLMSLPLADEGFELRNWEIGIVNMLHGIVGACVSLVLPCVIQRVNPVYLLRILPWTYIPFLLSFPELYYLRRWNHVAGQVLFWVFLLIFNAAKSIVVQCLFTLALLLMNNSIASKAKSRYQAIAAILGYSSKGMGPFLGSLLLSVGASINVFPFDLHFGYVIALIPLILDSVTGFLVSPALKEPLKEDSEGGSMGDGGICCCREEENGEETFSEERS